MGTLKEAIQVTDVYLSPTGVNFFFFFNSFS